MITAVLPQTSDPIPAVIPSALSPLACSSLHLKQLMTTSESQHMCECVTCGFCNTWVAMLRRASCALSLNVKDMIGLSTCLPVCLPVYLSVCLSVLPEWRCWVEPAVHCHSTWTTWLDCPPASWTRTNQPVIILSYFTDSSTTQQQTTTRQQYYTVLRKKTPTHIFFHISMNDVWI